MCRARAWSVADNNVAALATYRATHRTLKKKLLDSDDSDSSSIGDDTKDDFDAQWAHRGRFDSARSGASKDGRRSRQRSGQLYVGAQCACRG